MKFVLYNHYDKSIEEIRLLINGNKSNQSITAQVINPAISVATIANTWKNIAFVNSIKKRQRNKYLISINEKNGNHNYSLVVDSAYVFDQSSSSNLNGGIL